MADIVNLRRERKRKARILSEREAEANRALFGRPKAEREQAGMKAAREARFLDGHLLRPEKPGGEQDR